MSDSESQLVRNIAEYLEVSAYDQRSTEAKYKAGYRGAGAPADEISEDKMTQVINLIKALDSNWKIGMTHVKSISSNLRSKIYDLSGGLLEGENEGVNNKVRTFYTSCSEILPNNYVTLDANPAEMTWMGWHAFKENYDGYLRWAFDNWKLNDPFDARDGAHTSGDFSMIYRASNNTPSKRNTSL